MKDKKFNILVGLGIVWLIIFLISVIGHVRVIHPRFLMLLTFVCIAWFGYWTISNLFKANKLEQKQFKESNRPSESEFYDVNDDNEISGCEVITTESKKEEKD